jgi:membrane protein YdbS with pleckstrin-like domain
MGVEPNNLFWTYSEKSHLAYPGLCWTLSLSTIYTIIFLLLGKYLVLLYCDWSVLAGYALVLLTLVFLVLITSNYEIFSYELILIL